MPANAGDGGGVLRFVRAEQVEGEAGRLRLAGHDMEQVGGRHALRRATTDASGQLEELQERLRNAENTLAVYKAQNNSVAVAPRSCKSVTQAGIVGTVCLCSREFMIARVPRAYARRRVRIYW